MIVKPQMVRIKPGKVFMGSPPKGEGTDDERPQHWVRIDYAFEVSKYAVTFREWDSATLGLKGLSGEYRPDDEGWGRGWRPVINVSWDDVQAYIKQLNAATGKTYRLLSEAEWEYCCRAGTDTVYSFGPKINRRQANFSYWQTVPVNRFPTNQFGLVGMHGNALEWCEDCWNEDYNGAPDDGSPWHSGECQLAVQRGGSWFTSPRLLRSACRYKHKRDARSSDIGFRLARTLPR